MQAFSGRQCVACNTGYYRFLTTRCYTCPGGVGAPLTQWLQTHEAGGSFTRFGYAEVNAQNIGALIYTVCAYVQSATCR